MARKAKEDKETKVLKSIPSSENGVTVSCITRSNTEYWITQNIEKNRFTLWKIVDGGYEKISIASSPLDFDEILYPDRMLR